MVTHRQADDRLTIPRFVHLCAAMPFHWIYSGSQIESTLNGGESWRTVAIPMGNPYCSCKLTRVRSRRQLTRSSTPGTGPATWTVLQNDDPSQLGMRCNAFPEHQMARITSVCVPFRPQCQWYHYTTGALSPFGQQASASATMNK